MVILFKNKGIFMKVKIVLLSCCHILNICSMNTGESMSRFARMRQVVNSATSRLKEKVGHVGQWYKKITIDPEVDKLRNERRDIQETLGILPKIKVLDIHIGTQKEILKMQTRARKRTNSSDFWTNMTKKDIEKLENKKSLLQNKLLEIRGRGFVSGNDPKELKKDLNQINRKLYSATPFYSGLR